MSLQGLGENGRPGVWSLVPVKNARTPWKVEVVRRIGSATHFASLLGALGVDGDGGTLLELRIDQRPVTLSLCLHKGRVTGLDVQIDWPGKDKAAATPFVVLRHETSADVEGKARGINREVELGDQPFDREVYIDATASDREVRRVLSDIRAPVLELVKGGARLKVTPRALTAHWEIGSSQDVLEAERLILELTRLFAVVRAGVPSAVDAIERRGEHLPLWWGLALAPAVMLTVVAVDSWSGAHVVELAGAVLGALGVLALRPVVERQVKGDSGSFTRYRVTLALATLVFALVGLSLATIVNGAFDAAPPVVLEGVVVAQHVGSKGARSFTVQWRDGSTTSFGGSIANGTQVSQTWHPGALGGRWHEQAIFH